MSEASNAQELDDQLKQLELVEGNLSSQLNVDEESYYSSYKERSESVPVARETRVSHASSMHMIHEAYQARVVDTVGQALSMYMVLERHKDILVDICANDSTYESTEEACASLEWLFLDHMNVYNINCLEIMRSLRGLQVHFNYLTSLHCLNGLAQEILHCSHNELTSDSFPSLSSLRILLLDHNICESIPSFQQLPNIEQLSISHNLLKNIDNQQYYTNLKKLNLSYNSQITSLAPLKGQSWLTHQTIDGMTLSVDELSHIPKSVEYLSMKNVTLVPNKTSLVFHLPRLTHLTMASCKVEVFPNFEDCPNLVYLDLSSNLLVDIFDVYIPDDVQYVDVRGNPQDITMEHIEALFIVSLEDQMMFNGQEVKKTKQEACQFLDIEDISNNDNNSNSNNMLYDGLFYTTKLSSNHAIRHNTNIQDTEDYLVQRKELLSMTKEATEEVVGVAAEALAEKDQREDFFEKLLQSSYNRMSLLQRDVV